MTSKAKTNNLTDDITPVQLALSLTHVYWPDMGSITDHLLQLLLLLFDFLFFTITFVLFQVYYYCYYYYSIDNYYYKYNYYGLQESQVH